MPIDWKELPHDIIILALGILLFWRVGIMVESCFGVAIGVSVVGLIYQISAGTSSAIYPGELVTHNWFDMYVEYVIGLRKKRSLNP